MKEQLKKIFSDAYIFVNDTKSESYIKVESLDDTSPTYYQKGNFNIGLYFNRQIVSEIVMQLVTIRNFTKSLEKQTL